VTGGQGCKDQCVGPESDKGHCDWTTPKHCPGQSDDEYRTEASLYAIVSSPMMVGTDLRLMTPIMKELLLNPEAIAINQDYRATPGDVTTACNDPHAPRMLSPATRAHTSLAAAAARSLLSAVLPSPFSPVRMLGAAAVCSVALEKQMSSAACVAGSTFGCDNGTRTMWADGGCRGEFTCSGKAHVRCESVGRQRVVCECTDEPAAAQEVWVRRMSDGDFAVAMPNWGDTNESITLCLDKLGWPHGDTAHARSVWAKTDLGNFEKTFTATVKPHDTLLLRLSPAA
jgi:hypothetical protein